MVIPSNSTRQRREMLWHAFGNFSPKISMPGDERHFDPVDVNRGMPARGAKHAIRTHLAPIDVRFGSAAGLFRRLLPVYSAENLAIVIFGWNEGIVDPLTHRP